MMIQLNHIGMILLMLVLVGSGYATSISTITSAEEKRGGGKEDHHHPQRHADGTTETTSSTGSSYGSSFTAQQQERIATSILRHLQEEQHPTAANHQNEKQQHHYHQRTRLLEDDYTTQKYECNEVIATIAPNEVASVLTTFINNIAPEQAPIVIGYFSNLLKYGVQVKTVCAMCSESTSSTTSTTEDYDQYCGSNVYGNDMQHSGLVMTPLVVGEDDEELVLPSGTFPGLVLTHPTTLSRYDVPSQLWSSAGDHNSIYMLVCFLATATKGSISIAPDYMGYGLSQAYKSYHVRDAYLTAFLPLWMRASDDIR